MKKKKKNNNGGFTLVEVLGVVAILAIVITFSFNAYNYIIDKSQEKAVSISIDNIKSAAELYSKQGNEIEYYNTKGEYIYYCISVQDLVNEGLFGEELLNKKIKSSNGINNKSYIEIVKNKNNMAIVKTELTKMSSQKACAQRIDSEVTDDNQSSNQYYIYFDANNGTNSGYDYITEDNPIITLRNTSRTGYLFAGWYTNVFGGKKIGDSGTQIRPEYSMSLYAHWLPDPKFNRVNIKLNIDGGSLSESHLEGLGLQGSLLTLNGSNIIHEIIHVDKSELLPWENNIYKIGHSINETKVWCTKKNGQGKCYNLTTDYKSTDFCSNKNESCTITLYANWEPSKINISLFTNGGTLSSEHGDNYGIENDYVTKKGSVIVHSIPYGGSLGSGLLNWNNKNAFNMYKTGYTIESDKVWCISNEKCFDQVTQYEGSRFCDAENGDCSVELYANWIANTYTITLDNDGATTPGTDKLYEEYDTNWYLNSEKTKKMTPENNPIVIPTKTGYTFDGYYTDKNGEGTQVITENGYIVGNKTDVFSTNDKLYANWTALDYRINYYIGNADGTNPTHLKTQECTFGETCTLTEFNKLVEEFPYSSAETGGKYGWSFYGWSTEKEGTNKKYNDKASLKNQTTYSSVINIYALGQKKLRFSTGYEPKGFKQTETQIWNLYGTDKKYLTSIPIPQEDSLSSWGWTFIGYIGGSNSAANENTCIPASEVNKQYTPGYNECSSGYLRSKYKRELTVNYNANSGSGTTNKTVKIQIYNSGYGNNNGDTNTGSTLGNNTVKLAYNNFTRNNYLFTKWRTGATSGTQYNEAADFEELGTTANSTKLSQTMYAQWEEDPPDVATLTYNANGHGTAPAKVTMTYAAQTKAASAITATGYTFTKWCTNSGGTGTCYNAGAVVKAANTTPVKTTLHAQWQEKTATLTYKANGHGTAPASVTMKYSTATNAASALSVTGYTFKNWCTNSNGSGTCYNAGAVVKKANAEPSATTLYAQWDEKKATLTYNANGHGTAPAKETMKYSTATTAAAAIKADGYTFASWNTKSDGTGTSYSAGSTVKRANIEPTATTLYAKWTPIAPTISFSKGGTSGSPTKVRSGTTITVTCNSAAGVSSFDIVDDLSDHGTLTKPSSTEWKRTDKLGKERSGAYIKATCKSKNGQTTTLTKYYNVKEAAPELTFSKGSTSSSNRTSVTKGTVITITCTSSFGFKSFTTKDDTGDTGSLDSSTTTKRVRKIKLGSVRSSAYIKATCTADDDKSTSSTRYYKVTSSSSGGSSSGGTSSGSGCFLPGTKVLTINGYKSIDKILVGDYVLSYNVKTKKNEYKKVTYLFTYINELEDLYTITIDNKELNVTEYHNFYVFDKDRNYKGIAAKDIKIGDVVKYADGSYHKVTNIKHTKKRNTVHNLEVEGNHNYYVGDMSVLVHNQKRFSCNTAAACKVL